MGPCPGRRRVGRRVRFPAVGETSETIRGDGGVGAAPRPERETRIRVGENADGVGHHGKSTRALGTALRERGGAQSAAAVEVTDTAFANLRAAQVSTAAACALTGRSRATHY